MPVKKVGIRELEEFLKTCHTQEKPVITAQKIAEHFERTNHVIVSDGGVEVPIRNVIRDAIRRGRLIGSCNKGFYAINTIVELETYLNSLQSRAEAIIDRRKNLINNWNREHPEQPTSKPHLQIGDV